MSCLSTHAQAAVPQQINYQGYLTRTNGTPLDTTVTMMFKLYTDSTGTPMWTENHASIQVVDGLFNVRLGQLVSLPDAMLNQPQVWLGVTVGVDAEMTPRTRLISVGYSYRVGTLDGASGGVVTGDVNIVGKGNIGMGNTNTGVDAFVAGSNNTASGNRSVVGGGQSNTAFGDASVVSGGVYNHARGEYSSVAGGGGILPADSNSASGSHATIGGGKSNVAADSFTTVAGGLNNQSLQRSCTIGGGESNLIGTEGVHTAWYAVISGGSSNTVRSRWSTIGGGSGNTVRWDADESAIGGGYNNVIWNDAEAAVIGGGYQNSVGYVGDMAVVGGGGWNNANGTWATVPGGQSNVASGRCSFAAGRRAHATHAGSFVWGDSTEADVSSTAPNSFVARASGGVTFWSNASMTSGVYMGSGWNDWNSTSDSTKKRNARVVDTKDVLEKVTQMPIKQWSYKSQDPSIEHIGPMAQDFWKQFHVGDDSLMISTIDPSGIALAAIQELTRQNKDMQKELIALRARVQSLEAQQQLGIKEK